MLKKIKSLFIIEDEKAPKPQGEPSGGEVEQPAPRQAFQFDVASGGGDGVVQDKFLEVLFNALESHDQDGFDYLEFKDFLKSLAQLQMDEPTRFKSAYATAQTMGTTKEKILTSAKAYLDVLAKEEKKFQDALAGQKEKNLTGKQEEIKALEKTIQQKQADIEKLTAGIESDRQQIRTLETEINEASDKIMQTAKDFDATYKALVEQIQSDVENIEHHL